MTLRSKQLARWCIPLAFALLSATLALAALVSSVQATSSQKGMHAVVTLKHAPSGNAELRWNAQNSTLTVKIMLTGLQAGTTHPAHIHTGDCSSDGKVIYPLNNVVADSAGNAMSTTMIPNVSRIPATGWYINVHSGPTMNTAAEALPVSCGTITNPSGANIVTVPLGTTIAANQSARGMAYLDLDQNNMLTVRLTVYHLVAGSKHAAHIHAGSCENQTPGSVIYPLTTLTANAQGVASTTTVIPNVRMIPATGWYINVHFGTNLALQTDYDPIACGNVVLK